MAQKEEVQSENLKKLSKITEESTSLVSEEDVKLLMGDCLSETKFFIDWMDTSTLEVQECLTTFWSLKDMDKKILNKDKSTTPNDFLKQIRAQKAEILTNQNKALKRKIEKLMKESEILKQELQSESNLLKEQTKCNTI